MLYEDYPLLNVAGILPASLNPRNCRIRNIDPVIRVGAVGESSSTEIPELYVTALGTGSNYGSDYVDILSPGQAIPVLSEVEGYARLVGGTSESAAIVTATASLIVKCKPLASSQEIRDIILSTANYYPNLEYAVDKGKVLNIVATAKKGCYQDYKIDETKFAEADNTNINQSQNIFLNIINIILPPAFIIAALFKMGIRCPHPGVAREEY